MNNFKIVFYLLFWNDIMNYFNITNCLLQNFKNFLCYAATAYTCLKSFFREK